mgnify:CR=1 FL=1
MSMNLANVLRNPKSPEFQNIYVCLGKRDGKKQYAADCRRLKIQISMQGMQTIEKGFSRRERVAYSNNCDVNSSLNNWNNDSKRGYSCDENKKRENEERKKKELEEQKQKEQKQKQKKQKEIEKEEEETFSKWSITNYAVEDSWDE